MDKITLEQFGARIKQKYPQYGSFSDVEIAQRTLNKFPQYRKSVIDQNVSETGYDVPSLETREQKIARYDAETAKLQEEAKKAQGFGAKLKAVGSALAPSQTGLGISLGKIFGGQQERLLPVLNESNRIQTDLIKKIREVESGGGDATRLKQLYNAELQNARRLSGEIQGIANLPTTSEVVGQLAGTGLDILTAGTFGKAKTAAMGSFKLAPSATSAVAKTAVASGLPELSKVATQKASGLFTRGGAANLLTGAGIGYASDVTSGLQGLRGEDRTGAKAFIPGLGTAIGTAIPAISETTQSIKNVRNPEIKTQKVVQSNKQTVQEIADNYAKLRKVTEKAKGRGYDVVDDIANTDLLAGTVDNTGTIRTANSVEELNKVIRPAEDVIRTNLEKEGKKLPLSYVKKILIKDIESSNLEGEALENALAKVNREMAGLSRRADADGFISLAKIHDAKVNKYATVDYLNPSSKIADKQIAKSFKEIVAKNSKSVDVNKVNKELGRFYAMQDFLEKMDGAKVKGGKLGKYFAQTVGGIVGSHFGPLGAIIGAEAGGMIKGEALSRTLSGRSGKMPVRSQVLEEAITSGRPNPAIELPSDIQSYRSNNLGNLNTSQTNTTIPNMNAIPGTLPQSTKGANELSTLNRGGNEVVFGAAAGFEIDENGEVTFNPEKAALGMIGVAGLTKSQAIKALSKKVDDVTKNVMVNFIDVVRGNQVKVIKSGPNKGMLDFASPQAEKAFNDGLDLVNGNMFRASGYTTIQEKAPAQIANYYDDILVASGKKANLPKSNFTKASDGKFTGSTPKTTTDLMKEAKKYKSAEEFVKAQGTPVYHGSAGQIKEFKPSNEVGLYGKGNYFYSNKNEATEFIRFNKEGKITEAFLPKGKYATNAQFDEAIAIAKKEGLSPNEAKVKAGEMLKQDGFVGIEDEGLFVVFDSSQIKTKSQLTDMWDKANKK